MKNRQGIIIAAVLVVAAGIAYVAWRGNAPSTGTEGAIGAANRYAAKQITSEDVALTDADVQAFLQSDVFRAIQTNPDFRKVMVESASKAETERSIGLEGRPYKLPALFQRPGGRNFVISPLFLPSKKFTTLVRNKDFVEMVSTAESKAALEAYAEVARSQGVALSQATLDKNVVALLKNPNFVEFVTEVEKAGTNKAGTNRISTLELTTAASKEIMASKEYQALEKSEFFNTLVLDKAFQGAVARSDFVALVTSEKFAGVDGANKGALADVAASGALTELARNADYLAIVQDPGMVALITSEEVARLTLDKNFLALAEMANVGTMLERNEVQELIATAE